MMYTQATMRAKHGTPPCQRPARNCGVRQTGIRIRRTICLEFPNDRLPVRCFHSHLIPNRKSATWHTSSNYPLPTGKRAWAYASLARSDDSSISSVCVAIWHRQALCDLTLRRRVYTLKTWQHRRIVNREGPRKTRRLVEIYRGAACTNYEHARQSLRRRERHRSERNPGRSRNVCVFLVWTQRLY